MSRPLSPVSRSVLAALTSEPATVRQVANRLQLSYRHAAAAVYNLKAADKIERIGSISTERRPASLFAVRRADPVPADLTAALHRIISQRW